MNPPQGVPASALLERYRDTPSGAVPAVRLLGQDQPTPPAVPAAPAIAPPPWETVFPAHVTALRDDLARRGQDPAQWEICDGKDLGVDERGHTIGFTMRKRGTELVVRCDLTLCRGKASVRVH
jgi:hypothetical protein